MLPPLGELPERDHSGKRQGTAPLLEVKGLDAQYGEKPVLYDVSLDVRPHRCLAVVGESGAGKTTFARCLVGLHSRWTGEIAFGGEALSTTGASAAASRSAGCSTSSRTRTRR